MSLALILMSLAAQGATPPPPSPPALTRRWTRTFISPMGEPFRPASRGDDALENWFGQADADRDGRLTIAEMQKDAARFFATLDINHDGEIDPDETAHYESIIAPEVTSGSSFGMDAGSKGRFRFSSGNDSHQGAGRFGLLDLPEPVVSADANFNRGVSTAEFAQAARQRFLALDLDHRGYLTLPALEVIRPAPPPGPKKSVAPDMSDLPNRG